MIKARVVKVFGDKFVFQKTFDVLKYFGGIYGFDVFDADKNFLFHCACENESAVVPEIKWRVYRSIL